LYWLEDDAGHRLGPESDRSLAPLFLALELAQSGRTPDEMLLCARLETGERFELRGGPNLINAAGAAAGLPTSPTRTPGDMSPADPVVRQPSALSGFLDTYAIWPAATIAYGVSTGRCSWSSSSTDSNEPSARLFRRIAITDPAPAAEGARMASNPR